MKSEISGVAVYTRIIVLSLLFTFVIFDLFSMTGVSRARNFHLARREMLKPGFFADVNIFNHDAIADLATF